MNKYKVNCLDAVYDSKNEMFVLNCIFEDIGQRLVALPKSDFHYKTPGQPVPDIEAYKTAKLFKGKPFYLVMESDPNRTQITQENYEQYIKSMVGEIDKEMAKVNDGLVDEAGQIQRRLGRLMEEGKLDVSKLLSDEIAIRARLGGL